MVGAIASRIIPACAGQLSLGSERRVAAWDHPRLCGAVCRGTIMAKMLLGSSPLVRGSSEAGVSPNRCPRIIPACAGQFLSPMGGRPHSWDHPRLCGAVGIGGFTRLRSLGSSPLVRGSSAQQIPASVGDGIIPACAGQFMSNCTNMSLTRDHPRLCGAVVTRLSFAVVEVGSSPLVRGSFKDSSCRIRSRGIIPACAGQFIIRVTFRPDFVGSSPLVRGS